MARTLAVGFFDGVHLGHQSILAGADEVLTFANHPLSILSPDRAPRLIMSLEDRLATIRACGVREVTVLSFTKELARLEPAAFAANYLAGRRIRCGANWRFGRDGKGDADFLCARGYEVTVVPSVSFAPSGCDAPDATGEIVSSTRIRAALESGRIASANAMLGHPFRTPGRVFAGKGEGSKIGYPTVNLKLESLALALPFGVYVVEAGGARGLANFGFAPTFADRAWTSPVLEIHFTRGLPESLAGKERLAVSFLAFIRPERKFSTVEELQAQIAEDFRSADLNLV